MKKEELKQGKYSSLDADVLKLSMDNYYYRWKGKGSIGFKNFLGGYTAKEVKAFYRNKDYGRSSIYKKYNHVAFMEVIFKLDYPEYQTYLSETEKTFDVLKTKTNEISIVGTKTYQELFVDDNSKILPELVKKFYKI